MVRESIDAAVTRVSSHTQRVVVCLILDYERAVFGVVPATISSLQVKPQLVAAVLCQLSQQVVAQPEVAPRIVESDFALGPRTVEEVGPVNVLLDQQRDAVGCTTYDV